MVREMKDSGLEWAGVIPAEWTTNKGKYFMQLLARPVDENDGVITCFRDGEVTLRSNRREEGFTFATVEAGYQGIEPGDLVVHGMDGFAGAIGISDSRGKGTPALNVLDCSENKKYIMYLLRTMAHTELFMALATGIRVRTCDTSWKKLRELDYIIPPTTEQERIVAFIEKQCAEIDALTTDIQAQIETLEKYKRSVITEAVTKGLNPNVPMKDTGIICIGSIPLSWPVSRFKYHATVKANLVQPEGYEDFPQIAPDNIEKNTGKLLSHGTVEEAGIISGNHLFHRGQILYSKIRPNLNKAIIAPFDGLCSADMYPIETNEDTKFVLYLMLSNYFVEQVSLVIRDRVKMPKINQDELGQIRVVIPCMIEQNQIVAYLDAKCAEIDAIIEGKRQQLATLEEYKKSVIFEYVTGKKEVPVS